MYKILSVLFIFLVAGCGQKEEKSVQEKFTPSADFVSKVNAAAAKDDPEELEDVMIDAIRAESTKQNLENVKYFFDEFPDAHLLKSDENVSVLHLACTLNSNLQYRSERYFKYINNDETIYYLLGKDKDINNKTSAGETPWFVACMNCSLPVIKKMHEMGGDFNEKNQYNKTAFHQALHEYGLVLREIRITANSSLDKKDPYKCRLVLAEKTKECVAKLNYMLKNGANPNDLNNSGGTALATAIYFNNPDLAELLLKKGAKWELLREADVKLALKVCRQQGETLSPKFETFTKIYKD